MFIFADRFDFYCALRVLWRCSQVRSEARSRNLISRKHQVYNNSKHFSIDVVTLIHFSLLQSSPCHSQFFGPAGRSDLTMSNLTTSTSGNQTLILNPDLCTLQTCDLSLANFTYIPNLAGNALYLAIFAILFFVQLGLGIRYRIWGFMCAMLLGLVCRRS